MQFVKESIFVSAIRSFFNALLAMIGVLIGLSAIVGVGMAFSGKGPVGNPDNNVMMDVLPDAEGNVTMLGDGLPVILQIDIDGVIGLEDNLSDLYESYLRISKHSNLIKGDRIKGVFLNITSPGGAVSDSDITHHALTTYKEKYKVPMYAFGSMLCASGGYMVACAADKIHTTRTCIVGSVGVKTGPFFNYHGLMDKYGVKALELSAGKDKVKYPQYTAIEKVGDKDSDQSYQDLSAITEQLYEQFTSLVDQSRNEAGLTKSNLINLYGARVYIGPEAEKLGYVDNGNSSRQEALADLAKAAGIEEGVKYQVIRFKHKRSPLQSLVLTTFKMWTMKATEWITGVKHGGALDGKLLYMYDDAS